MPTVPLKFTRRGQNLWQTQEAQQCFIVVQAYSIIWLSHVKPSANTNHVDNISSELELALLYQKRQNQMTILVQRE